jgi:hypothetical protein
MEILKFIGEHPFLVFFCLLVVCQSMLWLIGRCLRHFTLSKHGYPPPHCDADGDFKEKDDYDCPVT